MNPIASNYSDREDAARMNLIGMSVAAGYVGEVYGGECPPGFYSLVVAMVEDQLRGALGDLDLPHLEVWRGEQAAA